MAEPFVGEIRLFSFGTVPSGWAQCNGQILSINTHAALFMILGNAFGGDGKVTFALPNLCGRAPCCISATMARATSSGEEAHTLTIDEMPQHAHDVTASSTNSQAIAAVNNQWGTGDNIYAATPNDKMSASALASSGGSQPHQNMQPYLVANFCIALVGIFPPKN